MDAARELRQAVLRAFRIGVIPLLCWFLTEEQEDVREPFFIGPGVFGEPADEGPQAIRVDGVAVEAIETAVQNRPQLRQIGNPIQAEGMGHQSLEVFQQIGEGRFQLAKGLLEAVSKPTQSFLVGVVSLQAFKAAGGRQLLEEQCLRGLG